MGHTPLCALEYARQGGFEGTMDCYSLRTSPAYPSSAATRHGYHEIRTKHHAMANRRHVNQHTGSHAAARRQHPPW